MSAPIVKPLPWKAVGSDLEVAVVLGLVYMVRRSGSGVEASHQGVPLYTGPDRTVAKEACRANLEAQLAPVLDPWGRISPDLLEDAAKMLDGRATRGVHPAATAIRALLRRLRCFGEEA